MKVKKYKHTALLGILFLFTVNPIFSQRERDKDIILDISRLEIEIRDLKDRVQDEANLFDKYQLESMNIIKQKENEIKELEVDVSGSEREIFTIKNKIRISENRIDQILKRISLINNVYADFIGSYKKEIENGIPFEISKRTGLISAIEVDLSADRGGFEEYFTRVDSFLSTEERMGYDSEVITTIQNIDGVETETQLLRVGRIFFATVTEDKTYIFKKTNDSYILDIDEDLSIKNINQIQDAVKVIQGNKPPEFLELPIALDIIEVVE